MDTHKYMMSLRIILSFLIVTIIISMPIMTVHASNDDNARIDYHEDLPVYEGRWFTAWYILYTGGEPVTTTTQHYSLHAQNNYKDSVLNYTETWKYDGLALYEVHIYALALATAYNNSQYTTFLNNTIQDLFDKSNIESFVVDDRIVQNTIPINTYNTHGYKKGKIIMNNRYIYVHNFMKKTLHEEEKITLSNTHEWQEKVNVKVNISKLIKKLGFDVEGDVSVTHTSSNTNTTTYSASFDLDVYQYNIDISYEGKIIEETHIARNIEGYIMYYDSSTTYKIVKQTFLIVIYSSVPDAITYPGS